jgi:hypothetical protein
MAGMTYGGFFTGNFHGTCMRLGNPWDLKGYRQKHGEPLRDYIRCFSQKYHELPGVADADFISTFWYGTTCHSLVHELDCEQPRTTKELIDIATQHTSGEVAVGATFTLVNAGTTASGGRAAVIKTTVKRTKKSAKGGEKGQKCQPHRLATMASDRYVEEEINDSGEKFVVAAKRDFKQCSRPPRDHFLEDS